MPALLKDPYLKLALILLNAISSTVVAHDPNPVLSDDEKLRYKVDESVFDKYWTADGWFFKYRKLTMHTIAILELTALISHRNPALHPFRNFLARLIPALASPRLRHIRTTRTYLLATALITSAALLRSACYRTLGRLFTFTLAIRRNHTLVTSGPYAYVRHPSYTGSLAFFVGLGLAMFGRGSWLGECVLRDRKAPLWAKMVAVDIMSYLAYSGVIMVRRIEREDRALKEEFGEEWDRWAERTPYRLIPYIY